MRSPYETGGYDLVVQVSEREYNDQLATLFATGAPQFPHQVRRTFAFGSTAGEVNFLFDTPWLSFDAAPQHHHEVARYDWGVSDADLSLTDPGQVTLCLPFSEASLVLNEDIDPRNIDGCVLVQERVQVQTPEHDPNQRTVGLEFAAGIDRVEVGFTPDTVDRLAAESSILPQLLRAQIQTEVSKLFEDDVERIALSPQPITVADDDNPVTPADLEATVLREGTNALAFLIPTHPDTAGTASALTGPETTGREPVVILFDADTLLAGLIRPKLAAGLGTTADAFAEPCQLRGRIDLDTSDVDELDDLDIDWLTAEIVDDHIEIRGGFEGYGSAEGFPFDVDGDFRVSLYFELDDGALAVRVEADEPNINITFPWWVYVASVAIGALSGGILGIVIAGTIVIVADVVADSIADGMVGDMFGSQLGGVDDLNVPLGPAAAGLELTAVDLTTDALALGGRPVSETEMPIAARAFDRPVTSGVGVDLDTGETSPQGSLQDGVDLVWGSGPNGRGLYARSNARFAPLGAARFEALTVVDLEQAEYERSSYRTFVPAGLVPEEQPVSWFGDDSRFVFAVQTSENRYAKCRVTQQYGRLSLDFVTYDRPTPGAEILVTSEVIESEQIDEGTETWPIVSCTPSFEFRGRRVGGGLHTDSNAAAYTIDSVARRLTAEAQPRLLADPLRSIEWRLDGTVLLEGTGTLTRDGHTITYDVAGRVCTLTTELGQPLAAPLEVAVVDDRGFTVNDRKWIDYEGTRKNGGMPPSAAADVREEIEHCLRMAHDRRPFGPRVPLPDPFPPWAAGGGRIQPGPLRDPLTQVAGGEISLVEQLDLARADLEQDATRDATSGTNNWATDTAAMDTEQTRLQALSLDDAALRAALERGMAISPR